MDNLDYCLFPEKTWEFDQNNPPYSVNKFCIVDFMERAANIENLKDVFRLCNLLQQHYDFACFGAGLMLYRASCKPIFNHIYTDCDWVSHYINNNLIRVDPFVRHCVENINTLYWQRADKSVQFNDFEKKVIESSLDFGVTSIITVPWHGPNSELGGMKITCTEKSDFKESDIRFILPVIVTASHCIHEAFYRVMNKTLKNKEITLSPREREVLLWVASGNDSWRIGQMLNISENTVNTHLKNAYKKLNVRSRQHAVAKAVCLKLIHV